jgi:choline kinase
VISLAVILAAGRGNRLRPLTDSTPKCLLDVAGRPLIGHLLDALVDAGVHRVVVVTGYLEERLVEYLATRSAPRELLTVRNPEYSTTNNAASLAAARGAIGSSGFLLCDADLIFAENPFPALLSSPDSCALAMDAQGPFGAEEMKVELSPDGCVTRISKALAPERAAGESLGVQKIGGPAVIALWAELAELLPREAQHAYYEDAFQRLIEGGIRFGVSRVTPGSWMEIDDAVDLAAARRRFTRP